MPATLRSRPVGPRSIPREVIRGKLPSPSPSTAVSVNEGDAGPCELTAGCASGILTNVHKPDVSESLGAFLSLSKSTDFLTKIQSLSILETRVVQQEVDVEKLVNAESTVPYSPALVSFYRSCIADYEKEQEEFLSMLDACRAEIGQLRQLRADVAKEREASLQKDQETLQLKRKLNQAVATIADLKEERGGLQIQIKNLSRQVNFHIGRSGTAVESIAYEKNSAPERRIRYIGEESEDEQWNDGRTDSTASSRRNNGKRTAASKTGRKRASNQVHGQRNEDFVLPQFGRQIRDRRYVCVSMNVYVYVCVHVCV
eukprot:GHVU01177028.1.p1 GENE.GHVU01177028.1~~GHVU01177028.1.p1  ORF type:complete len:314 (+),score=24.14 GHVU01177028.1:294-1235(+)